MPRTAQLKISLTIKKSEASPMYDFSSSLNKIRAWIKAEQYWVRATYYYLAPSSLDEAATR
jgi:hypothetical protein